MTGRSHAFLSLRWFCFGPAPLQHALQARILSSDVKAPKLAAWRAKLPEGLSGAAWDLKRPLTANLHLIRFACQCLPFWRKRFKMLVFELLGTGPTSAIAFALAHGFMYVLKFPISCRPCCASSSDLALLFDAQGLNQD